jgi:hypothetical protein
MAAAVCADRGGPSSAVDRRRRRLRLQPDEVFRRALEPLAEMFLRLRAQRCPGSARLQALRRSSRLDVMDGGFRVSAGTCHAFARRRPWVFLAMVVLVLGASIAAAQARSRPSARST